MFPVMTYGDWSTVFLLLCLLYTLKGLRGRAKYGPLPPGPKRLPILGNVLQVSLSHMEVTLASLAKRYGKT